MSRSKLGRSSTRSRWCWAQDARRRWQTQLPTNRQEAVQMSSRTAQEVVMDDLSEHDAVKAWAQISPVDVEPESIQVLQVRKKSAVYRLAGVGPRGAPVIAKRGVTCNATTEQVIYEKVLPRLPLPALRCYGSLEDADPD